MKKCPQTQVQQSNLSEEQIILICKQTQAPEKYICLNQECINKGINKLECYECITNNHFDQNSIKHKNQIISIMDVQEKVMQNQEYLSSKLLQGIEMAQNYKLQYSSCFDGMLQVFTNFVREWQAKTMSSIDKLLLIMKNELSDIGDISTLQNMKKAIEIYQLNEWSLGKNIQNINENLIVSTSRIIEQVNQVLDQLTRIKMEESGINYTLDFQNTLSTKSDNINNDYNFCQHSTSKFFCMHPDCVALYLQLNCYECLTISHMNKDILKEHITYFKQQDHLESEKAKKLKQLHDKLINIKEETLAQANLQQQQLKEIQNRYNRNFEVSQTQISVQLEQFQQSLQQHSNKISQLGGEMFKVLQMSENMIFKDLFLEQEKFKAKIYLIIQSYKTQLEMKNATPQNLKGAEVSVTEQYVQLNQHILQMEKKCKKLEQVNNHLQSELIKSQAWDYNTIDKKYEMKQILGQILENFSISNLVKKKFVKIYDQPMMTSLKKEDIDLALAECHSTSIVCVGAVSAQNPDIYLLCAIDFFIEAFQPTSLTGKARKSKTGQLFWYYVYGYSLGFSPDETIDLKYIDHSDNLSKLRYSLSLTGGGGGRIGTNMNLEKSTEFRKVIYICK